MGARARWAAAARLDASPWMGLMRSDRGSLSHAIFKPPLTALLRICQTRSAAARNIDGRELPEPLPEGGNPAAPSEQRNALVHRHRNGGPSGARSAALLGVENYLTKAPTRSTPRSAKTLTFKGVLIELRCVGS